MGELMPRPQGRRRASSLDVHEAFIVGMIEERKDITLNEMVARLDVALPHGDCYRAASLPDLKCYPLSRIPA